MDELQVAGIPRWKKVVFALIPIIVFLAVLEIILRTFVPVRNVRTLCFHPIMGQHYCANATGSIMYDIPLTTNSDGLIDKNYPVERTPGTKRVAVLGDSMTAAEATPMGLRFHELWEKRIPKRLGGKAEFLNFGVRAFGTWESLQMFHLKAAKYKPDLTVLNFYWGNDIGDNVRSLRSGSANPLNENYPDPTLWKRLQITRKNINKWLWNHISLYQSFRHYYNKLETKIRLWFLNDSKKEIKTKKNWKDKKFHGNKYREKARVDKKNKRDDKYFNNSEGLKLTRKLILKLKQEVEGAGGRFAVIHFGHFSQIHDYSVLPLNEFDAFLTESDIPHLNLFPKYAAMEWEDMLKTTLLEKHNDEHFSVYGQEVYENFTEDFIFNLLKTEAASNDGLSP